MRCAFLLLGCLAFGLVASACSQKSSPIAKLEQADGPVEKQSGGGAWENAALGTAFFIGDAARTADGGARLEISGSAQIAMQKHTVLRFGGSAGQSRIAVELGAIDLTGAGTYGLDIGDVKLAGNGTVRITANGNGQSSVQLTLGEAQVSTLDGQQIQLVVGSTIELGAAVVTAVIDAGTPDAAAVVVVPPDAMVVEIGAATIEVVGARAEVQLNGETARKRLSPGTSALPSNAKLFLGPGTTAKLIANGVTLDLGGGTRARVTESYGFVIEAGTGRASSTEDASVGLPGGAIGLQGTPAAHSDSGFEIGGSGTTVTQQRGNAKLTGAGDSSLSMSRGESAKLLKTGQIRPLEAIPTYFDFRVTPGESLTVHDPRPPTSVQFEFAGKCPEGGIIELDRDPRFRTAKVSAGKEAANHLVKAGSWNYRLRCSSGAGEGSAIASGRISVVGDTGSRALPKAPPVNPFDIDGRAWAFSYQSVIPDLAVKFPGAGSKFRLHLVRGNKDLAFDSSSSALRVQGSALSEGVYDYWFDRDGVKQDKMNTLKIDFDQTAPQVYIESPPNGKPWNGEVDVRGAVLPGWSAAVDSLSIEIDKQRRFAAKVPPPPGAALAIRLSHPQRGIHYYLRRAK
ncbi:MAG: hypothetical protein H6Q90_1843 [Deltaproteobacteria bacterium]|nr:hypothetical protein [Deltaproteobacteria bacterium]